MGGTGEKQRDDQVPRLTPEWEAKVADLSPQQGFLLSRIDGVTNWGELRTIAGLPPEQVDTALERWLKDGLLEVEGSRMPAQPTSAPPTRVAGKAPAADSLDTRLDLSSEFQEEILAFEARLEQPYHEILGVPVDADTRAIKRAYFKLSKLYHPDRYFRQETGEFSERLNRVFKKIALAYELMMDPTTRAELHRSMHADLSRQTSAARPGSSPPPKKFSKHEWMSWMRSRFKIPDEVVAVRRSRARELASVASVARHQSQWNEAASAIRLAIAFDPWSDDYKELFAEIQVEVIKIRAATLLEEASGAWDSRSRKEALALFEEVIAYRPSDASAHEKAAQLASDLDDLETAREYAERACELAPETSAHRVTLARILRLEGLKERARSVLEEACALDPQNCEIKDEFKKLRARSGPSIGGKR